MFNTMLALVSLLISQVTPVQEAPPLTPNESIEMRCMPREQLVSHIKVNNKAVPLFVAMADGSKAAIEVWRDTTNPAREMWITFLTKSDGNSCIIMQGAGYGFADPSGISEPPKFSYDDKGHSHPYTDPTDQKI